MRFLLRQFFVTKINILNILYALALLLLGQFQGNILP
jgi:hypothetical protein